MTRTQSDDSLPERLARDGFVLVPKLVSAQIVSELIAAVESADVSVSRSGGIRNLASTIPRVREFAQSEPVKRVTQLALSGGPRLVRSILFDKTPGANWNLGWHQDLTVAVEERHDVHGYGPWTTKAGVTSVQPPNQVLEQMVSARLHLDPCGPDNGPLRVVPGSHTQGRFNAEEIDRLLSESSPEVCVADAGTALLMSPLLLHASAPSAVATHRRVIHLDFAACDLAPGLEWSRTV